MVFKKERSYALLVHEDYVFLDGLNDNVDVFRVDDFRYVMTLDIKQSKMISAIVH